MTASESLSTERHSNVPLLEARGLRKHFVVRQGLIDRLGGRSGSGGATVRAVDGVDLALERGELLAIVGESGSGKTTLGRCLSRLIEPDDGQILFDGQDLRNLSGARLRRWRRRLQMIFQDPLGSLDPRQRVGSAVAEPIRAHRLRAKESIGERVEELFDRVNLDRDIIERFPHQLSGGQRQRVAIARALAAEPDVIIADEPVAALDVSVRSQVINLLAELRAELGLAIVFIAHDLTLVRRMTGRVAVMYGGRFVETGSTRTVLSTPAHPYTIQLVESVPNFRPDHTRGRSTTIDGSSIALSGCRYSERCPIAAPECRREQPPLVSVGRNHDSACFKPESAATLNRKLGNLSQAPT